VIPKKQSEKEMPAPARIEATPEALSWIARLKDRHGPLMFYLSSGCCEGSSPMCFAEGDYRVNDADVLLGEVGGSPFYLSAQQFEYWRHTQLILDVTSGQGSGFSLEAPEGVSFLTRSRVFSDAEVEQLAGAGEPPRAA
jgi:uncharacterized protein